MELLLTPQNGLFWTFFAYPLFRSYFNSLKITVLYAFTQNIELVKFTQPSEWMTKFTLLKYWVIYTLLFE
jgi:hypothetical protein